MENIISAINLLEAVRSTMDTISVVGIENQDKFVGCANAIQTVSQTLGKFVQDAKAEKIQKSKPVTSLHAETPTIENVDTEVSEDG